MGGVDWVAYVHEIVNFLFYKEETILLQQHFSFPIKYLPLPVTVAQTIEGIARPRLKRTEGSPGLFSPEVRALFVNTRIVF